MCIVIKAKICYNSFVVLAKLIKHKQIFAKSVPKGE